MLNPEQKVSFNIQIQFTKNATWQGQIVWLDKNKKQNFRSELEMLKLMQEAIDETNVDSEESEKLNKW